MEVIICAIISVLANHMDGLDFQTTFTYLSIAIGLMKILKKMKHTKDKTARQENTHKNK